MAKQNIKKNIDPQEEKEYIYIANPEEKKRILNQRAKKLMAEVSEDEILGEQLTGIEFLLGDEHYFIESKFVSEVIYLKELTTLPCTPSFLLGIINVRGRILAVISLKDLLNLPDSGIRNANRVVLIRYSGVELGIVVDEIIGTRFVFSNGLQAIIPGITGTQSDYLFGITSDGLMILDFEKLLLDGKVNINQKVQI